MKKIRDFLFINTTSKQTVAKNTFWLFFGELMGRLFKLAIIAFATRQLGVDGWGVFSYAIAFISLFFLMSDLGVNTFIIREMSKEGEDRFKYLSSSAIIKMALVLLFFIAALVVAPHLGKIALGMQMIATISLLFLADGVREFALSINRSMEKMEREAFSKILMNAVIVLVGIPLILRSATPLSLAIAYASGSIVSCVFIFWSIRDVFKHFQWNVSWEDVRVIYNFSWPIIIISLFSFVFNIDTIMLGQMKSATDVGLYAAAQRLIQFISFLPSLVAVAIFPLLSKHADDTVKMSSIFERILVLIFAIGIPVALGGFLLGEELMSLLFGHAYATGGMTLGILMLSLLASFPNIILMNVIFSKNLQKTFIAATSFGVLINIILNFLLIPAYGAVGAALSLAATQLFIMLINWQKLRKIMPFSVIPKLGKIIIGSLIMSITIVFLNNLGMHVVATVAIAIAIYIGSLVVLRERSFGEIFALVRK